MNDTRYPVNPRTAVPLARAYQHDADTGRKNLQLLVQLRWIAMLGQLATILLVHFGFAITLPLPHMLTVLLGLLLLNCLSLLRLRLPQAVGNSELLLSLLVDVATLTLLLFLSGGASNPFVFLYLLQVILSAVLLKPWSTWVVLAITSACFAWLAYAGQPLPLPLDHEQGLFSLYIQGMLICFVVNAVLLVVFINRIARNRRAGDAHLAALRQRAAEEEHIVRMGLLASGAAHELGTPLATLSVILGDWRHMEPFRSDADLSQEVAEMQAQLLRCKTIVSGILLSAGETRGESSRQTTVGQFLDELLADWRATRRVETLVYHNECDPGLAIVSDSALKQSICNVLDNALEASPHWLRLEVTVDANQLIMTVLDEGAGFSNSILQRLGQPYQSSKGRPGSGLGLFLVMNVLRTLGGALQADNRPEGGARVTLSLPLAAITRWEEP